MVTYDRWASCSREYYTDPIELSQAMQGLHMRAMLGYDDDGADEEGVNDIDITLMVQHNLNHDYQLGGSVQLQSALHSLIH